MRQHSNREYFDNISVPLEKQTVQPGSKKFPAFYGTPVCKSPLLFPCPKPDECRSITSYLFDIWVPTLNAWCDRQETII